MGHERFVFFYPQRGIASALTLVHPDPDSTLPMIGESGAISGVLGAYSLLFPHARVPVLTSPEFHSRIVYLPPVLVLGSWLVLQLVSSALADPRAGGALNANIGGFITRHGASAAVQIPANTFACGVASLAWRRLRASGRADILSTATRLGSGELIACGNIST